jgi:hypothetical protein
MALESIRESGVFSELESLMASKGADNGPEGFTGDELSVHMGVGHRAALYKIKEWCRIGLVEYAGRRMVVNNVGSISCIPVYRRTNKP